MPVELLFTNVRHRRRSVRIFVHPLHRDSSFLLGEELCLLRGVWHEKERTDPEDDSHGPFNEEYPWPICDAVSLAGIPFVEEGATHDCIPHVESVLAP